MITISKWTAALAATLAAISVNIVEFEIILLSESLSLFYVLSCIALLIWIIKKNQWEPNPLLILSFLIGMALYTRPNNGILFPLAVVSYFLFQGDSVFNLFASFKRQEFLLGLACLCAPFLILVCSWCLINKNNNGFFTLSTLSGFLTTTTVGNFIELAPNQFAALRDPYVQKREQNYREYGPNNFGETIWKARDEYMKNSGEITGWDNTVQLSPQRRFALLSQKVAEMTSSLILHHPILYAKNIFHGLIRYWEPGYFSPSTSSCINERAPGTKDGPVIKSGRIHQMILRLWEIEKPIAKGLNWLFLLSVPIIFLMMIFRGSQTATLLMIPICATLLNSLASAAFAYVDQRNGEPYLPLVYLTVVIVFHSACQLSKHARICSVKTRINKDCVVSGHTIKNFFLY